MAELINKWEVVNKLIRLENSYQFYKEKWDAEVLYRRICELEIGIGKTPGLEVVFCKDCKYSHDHEINRNYRCHRHAKDGYSQVFDVKFTENDFCSYGERKDNEKMADK